ncbi:MAG: hypothetical protein RL011_2343 [Pseudomonadota bacterium]
MREDFLHGWSSLQRAAQPDVRVRVGRRIVQIDGEKAGVRAIVPIRPPKQRVHGCSRVRRLTSRESSGAQSFTQGIV